jgi:hypothetical protein
LAVQHRHLVPKHRDLHCIRVQCRAAAQHPKNPPNDQQRDRMNHHTTEPAPPASAQATAITLEWHPTGFCACQPVVNGDACPWNLDCHNCDKFVMSGADLGYWHRKREQWRTIAERAPDSTTANLLRDVFEPTARAIDGLEKALAAVGLLDDALELDLRRPQDYFGRLWSLAFRANELAQHDTAEGPETS